jgi:hypothetical protein
MAQLGVRLSSLMRGETLRMKIAQRRAFLLDSKTKGKLDCSLAFLSRGVA